MSFRSVDELDKFCFDECVIAEIKADQVGILIEVDALIVMPNNSQNTNYTKSYADTTSINLEKGVILEIYKEGYKRYDANDKLIDDIPDELMDPRDTRALLKSFKECYLYKLEKSTDTYVLGIEVPAADDPQGIESDIYRIHVSFEKAVFSWERYLNRVQE